MFTLLSFLTKTWFHTLWNEYRPVGAYLSIAEQTFL